MLSAIIILTFGVLAYVIKEVQLIAIMFVVLAIGTSALLILKAFFRLISIEITDSALTENLFTAKRGILDRDGWTVDTHSIQICKTEHPAFGLLLDYGNLSIRTPAGSVKVRNIPHPKQWSNEIQKKNATLTLTC